jgi:GLPGLI family protein
MKFNFLKGVFSYSILLISIYSFAQQDFQGKAYYKSKTSIDMSNFGRPDMNEDQKKRMADRMKDMFEKTFILTFNQVESIYKEEEKLESPGQGGGRFGSMMSGATNGNIYKNVKELQLLIERELFGKQFLIKEELEMLEWKMGSETKQIGQYMCFKATALKEDTAFKFGNFGPPPATPKDSTSSKSPEIKKEEPKFVEVVAWYTMQIPVNQGPGNYWGLPGLILELSSDRTTILCSKIVLNPDDKEKIKAPTKGKEITEKEYDVLMKNKMEEMRENFRRGGGRPGGGRRG